MAVLRLYRLAAVWAVDPASTVSPSFPCCEIAFATCLLVMMYTRASASDYDDWEKFGNPGWGSKDLIPLSNKVFPMKSSCANKL